MKYDDLVLGQFNEIAFKALGMVIEAPGRDYSLLVIQGGFGSGKTHLIKVMEAKLSGSHSVKSSSGNSIMNDMIQSMKDHKFSEFRQSLEGVDILIIDDFQELKNRTGTQDCLHKALENRVENKKQTIITCSRPIDDLEGICEELESFLKSSLLVEIQEPNFEDRLAITKQSAKSRELSLYHEVATFIAGPCTGNLREIDGAILKLEAVSKILKKEITLDLAKEYLRPRLIKIRSHQTQISETIDDEELATEVKCVPEKDGKYNKAVSCVATHRVASASFLQRRLGIGYHLAIHLIGLMELNGVIGPMVGSKPRKVLVPPTVDHNSSEEGFTNNIPLSDIISNYIPLAERGEDYEGVCPFHPATTPSLIINNTIGTFRCFHCSAGGTSVKFVMDFKNTSLNEALNEIEDYKKNRA